MGSFGLPTFLLLTQFIMVSSTDYLVTWEKGHSLTGGFETSEGTMSREECLLTCLKKSRRAAGMTYGEESGGAYSGKCYCEYSNDNSMCTNSGGNPLVCRKSGNVRSKDDAKMVGGWIVPDTVCLWQKGKDMVGGTYTKMDGTANTRSECLDKCLLDAEYNSVTYGMQDKKCYCDKLTDGEDGLTYISNSKYTSCYMTKLKDACKWKEYSHLSGGTEQQISGTYDTQEQCLIGCLALKSLDDDNDDDNDITGVTYGTKNKKCYCEMGRTKTHAPSLEYKSCMISNEVADTTYSTVRSGTCSLKPTLDECEDNVALATGKTFKDSFPGTTQPYGCYLYTVSSSSDYGLWFNTYRHTEGSCTSSRECQCKTNTNKNPTGMVYSTKRTGTCGIKLTLAECRDVMAPLLHKTFKAAFPGSNTQPHGCYLWTDENSSDHGLFFNTNAGSTGSCTSARECQCKVEAQLPIEPSYNRQSSGTSDKTITQSECEYIGRTTGIPFKGDFRSEAIIIHPYGCYMVTDSSDSDYGLWFNTNTESIGPCTPSRSCYYLKERKCEDAETCRNPVGNINTLCNRANFKKECPRKCKICVDIARSCARAICSYGGQCDVTTGECICPPGYKQTSDKKDCAPNLIFYTEKTSGKSSGCSADLSRSDCERLAKERKLEFKAVDSAIGDDDWINEYPKGCFAPVITTPAYADTPGHRVPHRIVWNGIASGDGGVCGQSFSRRGRYTSDKIYIKNNWNAVCLCKSFTPHSTPGLLLTCDQANNLTPNSPRCKRHNSNGCPERIHARWNPTGGFTSFCDGMKWICSRSWPKVLITSQYDIDGWSCIHDCKDKNYCPDSRT